MRKEAIAEVGFQEELLTAETAEKITVEVDSGQRSVAGHR